MILVGYKGKTRAWRSIAVHDGEVSFEEKNGILFRVFKIFDANGEQATRQVVVPQPLRQQVMNVAHSSILGGHLGVKKTTDKITSNFYWPGIHSDITRFCQSCDICQRTVAKGNVSKVPIEKMPLIDTPFKRVAVDLVGPIYPPSESGHRYILTLVDYATRYPDAVPLKSITTESVAEALVDMYSRLGVPEEVLSDMGAQFVSECMAEVSRPMCNGLVEKFNGTLKCMLKRLCSEQPKQWHRYINALLFAYREVPQASMGFSPFELLYGRTVRGPMTILKELWTEEFDEAEVKTSYQYVIDLREKLEQTLKLAREELKRSQARYQRYYNRNAKDRKFVVGDKVLILLPTDKNKLLMQWKGPFEVEKIVGTNDYGIQVGGKVKTFHANMLKKYIERKTADDVKDQKQELDGDDDGDDKENSVGGPVLHLTAASIIETSIGGSNGAVDDEELLELGPTAPKETAADVVLGERLTEEQRVQLEELIDRYEHIFTDVPGDSNLTEHQIEVTSEEPIRSKPYAIPYNVRESLKEDIQAMLQMGVIRESKSPYASPVVVVRKKDCTNRVCVDYRKLNRLTVFDPAPGNTAEEIFQKMAKKKIFHEN